MTARRSIKPLALKLVDLLYVHDLRYFPPYESWAKKKENSKDTWQAIPYTRALEIASFMLAGITKTQVSTELTKQVLMQIERWMVESEGNLVKLAWENGKTAWYPVSLAEKLLA